MQTWLNDLMKTMIRCLLFVPAALATSIASGDTPVAKEFGDFNFDGHEDYRIVSEQPGNQCGWYDYFLFDPVANEHRYVETSFCKEEFDAEQKLVKTRVNGGMAGLIYAIHEGWPPEKNAYRPGR